MNKELFDAYLNEIRYANVIVTGETHNPCMFNLIKDVNSYRELVDKKEMDFIFTCCVKASDVSNEVKRVYLRYLNNALSHFIWEDNGQLAHANMYLTYLDLNKIKEQAEIQNIAQDFIHIQYDSLLRTIDILSDMTGIVCMPFVWNDKQCSLVEISYALYLGEYIVPSNRNSKMQQYWIEECCRSLHQPIPPHINQILYKLRNRETPCKFLTELQNQFNKKISFY